MPVTVVVGGQFGSEGKGKVANHLAGVRRTRAAVRVGGANAGHTVVDRTGTQVVFRHLPTAALLDDVVCVLSPGTYIDVNVLLREIELVGLTPERLYIDPSATIITEEDQLREQNSGLRWSISSTLSGTGAAVARRISRSQGLVRAQDASQLSPFVRPVNPFLRECLAKGERVLVEGTQGFGLSLLHSPFFPYVTSRDTTAATFVAEAGLSPTDVDEIYLVLRAFPIRVGGNSGPLPNEVDWDTITRESGSESPLIEYTSVTRTVRRIARFDPEIVRLAININQPTHVVLNHLDYVDARAWEADEPTTAVRDFVAHVETLIGRRIDYLGTSPNRLLANRPVLRRVHAS